MHRPNWATRERLQVAAYLFIVLVAMVTVATFDARKINQSETRVIERLQPQITRVQELVEGTPGTSGNRGTPGTNGSTGRQGIEGITGSQGLRGFPGQSGARGTPGPRGPQGATGSQGPQGERGLPGIQGVPGPVGQTVQAEVDRLRAEVERLRQTVCSLSPTC